MVMGRRASSASRGSGPVMGDNNFGSETQPVAPNLLRGMVSPDDSDCVTKHSSATQVRSNTSRSRRATETSVSNTRDYAKMASASALSKDEGRRLRGSDSSKSKDEAGRHRGPGTAGDVCKGSGSVSNTSRIIAERKRRATSNSTAFRRDPLAPVDHAIGPNRRATDMQAKISSMRRVNTASGALEKIGNHNFEQQKRPMSMRRNSTGLIDHEALEEHTSFRNNSVSESYDELYSLNRGNPNRRWSVGNANAWDKSNERFYFYPFYQPSRVGGRRRTTRGSDGGRRRATRSSSAGRRSNPGRRRRRTTRSSSAERDPTGGDTYEELRQLRINYYRQQQLQQQSPHRPRRRSSITNSELSYDLDEGEIAVISAPLGRRLSDATNQNSEMGEFLRLREAADEANESEERLYKGRIYLPRRSSDLPLGTSCHSSSPSVAVSAVPSDRTNDQKMFNDLLRGLDPSQRRGGRNRRWYGRHSLPKWTIIVALGLLFLASVILGAVMLESERGLGLGLFSGVSDESVEKNLLGPGTNVNHVKPPPSDIDGRCSSSNLPGSLPACLEACYPASCCYSKADSGTKCLDANDPESVKACQVYRPHCDIFHDTWDGAMDGVLRTPPADLLPICQQVNGKGEKQSPKLRARNLLVGTADDICSQYCEAAKCCAKDTVFHPYSLGLELSASGVYTDAATKEYVVTNCQDALVYQKNKDLCAEYDKFCTWNDAEKSEAWTSRSTLDPASTMTPSTSPSIVSSVSPSITMRPSPFSLQPSHAPSINVFRTEWITKRPIASPSIAPSNSISPSQKFKPSPLSSLSNVPTIPRANIASIEAACTGADNISLMAEGNEIVGTKCLDACSDGLCCYAEQLGYATSIESCYIGNEAVCEDYSACLWLQQSGELTTLDSTNQSNTVSNGTVIVNTDVTSIKSSTVVNETITTDNDFTSLNTSIVFAGTSAPSSKPSSASFETATTILNGTQYSNSTNTTSSTILTIPPPPLELDALCALGQGRFCTEICKDVSCCFEEAPELSCFSVNTEICEGYAPCSVLYPQKS
eukprot:scaffold31801_cov148-Skeletonema_menzelii.AAC.1